MIKIYDSLFKGECETDRVKDSDILIFEVDTVEEAVKKYIDAINLCEKKYNTKSYLSYNVGCEYVLFSNEHTEWTFKENGDYDKIIVDYYYDKWYITIDWGSWSHFIRIQFDTQEEYDKYMELVFPKKLTPEQQKEQEEETVKKLVADGELKVEELSDEWKYLFEKVNYGTNK